MYGLSMSQLIGTFVCVVVNVGSLHCKRWQINSLFTWYILELISKTCVYLKYTLP